MKRITRKRQTNIRDQGTRSKLTNDGNDSYVIFAHHAGEVVRTDVRAHAEFVYNLYRKKKKGTKRSEKSGVKKVKKVTFFLYKPFGSTRVNYLHSKYLTQ